MDKTSTEHFNDEVQFIKEMNDAHDQLDTVEREIVYLRNQIDDLRTKIRNLENDERDWKKVIRTKRYLADKSHKAGWACRNSGL